MRMSEISFRGAFTALITPFLEDGSLDEATLCALVERQIEGGIDGLVPCGTTGESVTMSDEEQLRVVELTVEQAKGRVPVVAGTGSNSTAKTIKASKAAEAAGADALLVVCPYYNKPTQKGLEAHFRAVCDAVSIPVMLYNIPGRSSIDMSAETIARLSDVPNLLAIKEATGTSVRTAELTALTGDRFAILSGDDGITLPIMSVGGVGVVSVTSNAFPGAVAHVTRLANEGKWDEARRAHMKLFRIHQSMFIEANPGPVKALMSAAGLLKPVVRLPLVWPEESTLTSLQAEVEAQGLTLVGPAKA